MEGQQVIAFAKKYGWRGATFETEWNGYNVYRLEKEALKPVNKHEPVCVGYPLVILERGGKMRISTPEESLDYMMYTLRNDPDYQDRFDDEEELPEKE